MRVIRGSASVKLFGMGLALAVCIGTADVGAERFNSSNYTIDASVGNGFGGNTSSTSYKMTTSGGEAVVGNGASGSYRLGSGYIAQLEKSIQLNVQTSDLAAYYALDSTAGTVAYDEATGNNSGRHNGSPAWVAGKIGNALNFAGSQAATIKSVTALNGETLTVMAWIKTTQAPGIGATASIIDKSASTGAYPYALQLVNGGTVSFSASDGVIASSVASAAAVNDGAWHHIIATRTDAGSMELYVDGVSQNTATDGTTLSTVNATDLGIGGRADATNSFIGTVDEVKIISRAYTDKEAAHEYASQNAGTGTSFTLEGLTGTASKTTAANIVIQTDAPGYTIAVSQDKDLTSGLNTIPPVSGTIDTPAAWTEGTTKGFGFTLTSGNGLAAKWGTNPDYNYAAFPGASTSVHTRSGYTGGIKEVLTSQYRLDIVASQPQGAYSNTVTYTATMVP